MTKELNEAIRSAAMLVSYHTTGWSAKVDDPDAARVAAEAAGASASAYRTAKNLMDGADARLKQIQAIQEAGRRTHMAMTLPWAMSGSRGGPRMLPTGQWMEYTKAISTANADFRKAVQDFLDHYQADVAIAQQRLNLVGDPAGVYPTLERLKGMFELAVDFSPIPAGTDFKGIPGDVKEHMEMLYEKRMQAKMRLALVEVRERVESNVKNLIDRLAANEPSFRSAAVENVRDLVPFLKGFQFLGDEALDATARAIDNALSGHDMRSLKDDATSRAIVREALSDALKLVAEWSEV